MAGKDSEALVQARVLKGFRDVLPAEAIIQAGMLETLRQVFQSFGYAPIETPHLEFTDILIRETAGDIGKQLFRFEDQGGRDVCLRFDLTVPFARFVVQHKNEIGIPFKRYAIGSVFRGERPQLGRYREFMQCDFDFVGVEPGSADAEIVQVIIAAFKALGLDDITVKINNRKFMNGIAAANNVEACAGDILRILDKLDKLGEAEVRKTLSEELSLEAEVISSFMDFISLSSEGSPQEVLARVKKYAGLNELTGKAYAELVQLDSILSSLESIRGKYRIDFSVARGLGYYTGIVYETVLNKFPQIGSVGGGGRYDDLTTSFSKEKLPGVGASIGLSRVLAALQEMKLVEDVATPAELLIAQMNAEDCGSVQVVAQKLRDLGVKVEVYPEALKLKKQFQYADRKGHRFVAVLGPDEIKEGTITLKDMKSGEQQKYSDLEACAAAIVF